MASDKLYAATIGHHLGPIRAYLEDASVSEVMINGPGEIFIEKDGELKRVDARFTDEQAYHAAINNLLQFTGKSLQDDQPLVDSRLPDGSRVHVAKAPCARHGTVMTIRKFSKMMLDMDWLIELGTLTEAARDYLKLAIEAERNLLVCGGTSSGKTSLLNALSRFIPAGQRIVVIEDSAELSFQQEHVISLEARTAVAENQQVVSIRDLFRSSLRLRPDRIVIGEVRGGEALDMIQAMTSGHGGSMGTLHANHPADALNRLETLALMSQIELPLHALRAQVASAIDVVVQMSRQIGGRRLVTQITEVGPMGEDGRYDLRNLFMLKPAEGQEASKQLALGWTGVRSLLAGTLTGQQMAELSAANRQLFSID